MSDDESKAERTSRVREDVVDGGSTDQTEAWHAHRILQASSNVARKKKTEGASLGTALRSDCGLLDVAIASLAASDRGAWHPATHKLVRERRIDYISCHSRGVHVIASA
ncbi:MAG: hypothetical protein AAGD00_08595 [Planctomycetota bacterium]